MKVTSGRNQTVITTDKWMVLFSYSTPVAAYDREKAVFYKTIVKYSDTTSRHLKQWVGDVTAQEMPQSFFDSLL